MGSQFAQGPVQMTIVCARTRNHSNGPLLSHFESLECSLLLRTCHGSGIKCPFSLGVQIINHISPCVRRTHSSCDFASSPTSRPCLRPIRREHLPSFGHL